MHLVLSQYNYFAALEHFLSVQCTFVQCTSVQCTCIHKRGYTMHCTGVHFTLGRFTLYKHNGQYLASLTVISVHTKI